MCTISQAIFLSLLVIPSEGSIGNGLFGPGIVRSDGPTIDNRLSQPVGGRIIRPLPVSTPTDFSQLPILETTDNEKRDAAIAAERGLWDSEHLESVEKKKKDVGEVEEDEEDEGRVGRGKTRQQHQIEQQRVKPSTPRDNPEKEVKEQKTEQRTSNEKPNVDEEAEMGKEEAEKKEIEKKSLEEAEAERTVRDVLPLRDWQLFENHMFSPSRSLQP